MSARRRSGIEGELERVSGWVLTPVRWVVVLGILLSIQLRFGLAINRPIILASVAIYALAAVALPRMRGRPLAPSAIQRLLLAADLLFSAAIFHSSDGIRSPYFGLWYLALIHAALLLGPRAGLEIATAVSVLVVARELAQPGSLAALLDVNFALGKLPFLLLVAWAAGRLAQDVREREAARRGAERRALTLEAEEARVRQEMEFARRVQESLLPLVTPPLPGFSLATLSCPARQVGGDTYDLIELPDGRLLIAIADVCGKGVPAALLAVAVQQGIRRFAGPEPAEVLAGVNRLLRENIPEEMFVTAACVVLDPHDGSAAASTAGHPSPLWWDHSRRCLAPVTGRSLALGLLPEWSGSTERWRLAPGDALLLYTDGVPDVKTDEQERLGEERLTELMGRSAPNDAQDWLARLRLTLDGCLEWPDDVTAVAVRRELIPELVPSTARDRDAAERAGVARSELRRRSIPEEGNSDAP
jgi:serine phosphatase RsbU (regulator of sigma subunit)